MSFFWETVKRLPAPLRIMIQLVFLGFFLFILLGWFNVRIPWPNYVIETLTTLGLIAMGGVLVYGGIIELRSAHQERRKAVFYKHMTLYGGIGFLLMAPLLLYDMFYPGRMGDTLTMIAVCIVIPAVVIGIAPAVYHDVQSMNRAGKEAVEKTRREQGQQKAESERLLAEGKAPEQRERNKARSRLQVALVSIALLLFLGCMIVMIVDTTTKSIPYDLIMLGFSCAWLLWSVVAILASQDRARDEQRPRRWSEHVAVLYFVAGVFFIAFYVAHYWLTTQHIIPEATASSFNVIPFIVLIATVIASSVITGRKEKARQAGA